MEAYLEPITHKPWISQLSFSTLAFEIQGVILGEEPPLPKRNETRFLVQKDGCRFSMLPRSLCASNHSFGARHTWCQSWSHAHFQISWLSVNLGTCKIFTPLHLVPPAFRWRPIRWSPLRRQVVSWGCFTMRRCGSGLSMVALFRLWRVCHW